MLEQKQKKIMSGQELTNRLAFLVAAIEACAIHLYGASDDDGRKREETRKGRSILLFLPHKPKDSDLRMYSNLVMHRYYRGKLAEARSAEEQARAAQLEIVQAIEAKLAEIDRAKEAASKAKQALFAKGTAEENVEAPGEGAAAESGTPAKDVRTENDAAAAAERLDALKDELARLRVEQTRAQSLVKGAAMRASAAASKIEELDRDRAGKKLSAFCALAEGIRAEHGLPEPALPPEDPRHFDDVIGRGIPRTEPDSTFISRAATDDSNSAILSSFIICNEVVAPAFAVEGIPACRDSLLRDTDPAFARVIVRAARKRVMELIALSELTCGNYPTRASANPLTHALLQVDAAQFAPAESNLLYEITSSEAFPVMVEEMLKPALLEGLGRFGDYDARDEFARKLGVLAFGEQRARETHASALTRPGAGADAQACYIERLRMRGEILAFLLVAALLGPEGVEAFAVDLGEMRDVLTRAPRPMGSRWRGSPAGESVAVLIEQIPNREGGFSLGRTWELDPTRSTLVGRAPFSDEFAHIAVPAGRAPFAELTYFASATSRAHALLEFDGKTWLASDAGSAYGTAVLGPTDGRGAGRLLVDDERCPLRSGDVIALAPIEHADGSVAPDPQFGFSYRFEVL